ncbi:hypothetical protein MTO96_004965 [Rhipicephalus appendiculatus]
MVNVAVAYYLWSTAETCQFSLQVKVDSAFLQVRVCCLTGYLTSANCSPCQGQGMLSEDHGQGSSCFPGNPYRKIKAIIVSSIKVIVTQLTVFLLSTGANCGFLTDICSGICSDLCSYVIQPFLQDGPGRPFLSRQTFITLLAPCAFRWTSARRSAMTRILMLREQVYN